MRQKFRMLSCVKVEARGYRKETIGIVLGSYGQLHGDSDVNSYQIYEVEDGKVCGSIAWRLERELTQIELYDRDTAEEMIEEYLISHPSGVLVM